MTIGTNYDTDISKIWLKVLILVSNSTINNSTIRTEFFKNKA